MSVNDRLGGFLFLFLKRVKIWRKMAAKHEQYGHNGGKSVRDMNNKQLIVWAAQKSNDAFDKKPTTSFCCVKIIVIRVLNA